MTTATKIETGDRVIRTDGGIGYAGMTGTVVETTDTRARVKWDDQTYPNPYDPERRPMVTRPGKRTWVRFASLAKS